MTYKRNNVKIVITNNKIIDIKQRVFEFRKNYISEIHL